MPDLVDVARELYALTPDEFTATRNTRAADARSDGEKDLAASIRSLQKPSIGAWAVNLLVREQSEEIEQVLELGRTLRAAQADLDSDALRKLSAQRRALVAALGKQAASLAKTSGHRISEAAVSEVEQTLNAAMADARAAAALKTARLIRALDSVGLEAVDLTDAVGAPEEGLLDAAVEAEVEKGDEEPPARSRPSKRTLDEARRKAADAARRADDAAAELEAVGARIDEGARRRHELVAELEDLKSEIADLEERISAADREARQREREREKAERSAEEARAAADRAQKRLDGLE
jgi:chromosome segregation ATPase